MTDFKNNIIDVNISGISSQITRDIFQTHFVDDANAILHIILLSIYNYNVPYVTFYIYSICIISNVIMLDILYKIQMPIFYLLNNILCYQPAHKINFYKEGRKIDHYWGSHFSLLGFIESADRCNSYGLINKIFASI